MSTGNKDTPSAGSGSPEELRWALLVLEWQHQGLARGSHSFFLACLFPSLLGKAGSWELLVPPASSKPRSPDHKIQFKVKSPRKCQSQSSPQTTATEHQLCTCNPSMCEAEAGRLNSRSVALVARASSRPIPATQW